MKHFKKTIFVASMIPLMLVSASCSANKVTNYADESNWAFKTTSNKSDYDLIFFFGTSVMEPTQDNGVGDISESMKQSGLENYNTVGSQLSFVKSNAGNVHKANVYIPMYRQMALNYALKNYNKHNNIIDDIRSKEPAIDLKASLDYYFTNYNKNAARPFIVAGHSQGGASLQVMLEDYFIGGDHKSYLKNCVAMYSIGYGVSKKWFDGLDKKIDGEDVIHFATGELDTHCVISWNTEGPGATESSILLPDEKNDTYIINPLNWKTDETYAGKDKNLGSLVSNPNYDPNDPFSPKRIISTKEEDLFDAQINLERGSIISNEPNSGTYVYIPPFGAIWGGKSLHCSDGPGFYVNTGRNLGDRLDAWFKK